LLIQLDAEVIAWRVGQILPDAEVALGDEDGSARRRRSRLVADHAGGGGCARSACLRQTLPCERYEIPVI
jgi:hypothetical protein